MIGLLMQISRGTNGTLTSRSITPGPVSGSLSSHRAGSTGTLRAANNSKDTQNVPARLSTTSGVIIGTAPVPGAARRGGSNARPGQQVGEKVFATESARRASKRLKPGSAGEGHVE